VNAQTIRLSSPIKVDSEGKPIRDKSQPAAPQTKTPEAPKTVQSDAPQSVLSPGVIVCVGDIFLIRIEGFNNPPNATFNFTVTQTSAGVLGFSHSFGGPYTEELTEVIMVTDSTGHGFSSFFFVKGLQEGESAMNACAPGTTCIANPLNVTVTDSCECPPIPIIP
jgi:hypothetical protein